MNNEIKISELIGGGYDEFWNSRHRYLVVKGSRGSKKSTTTAIRFIYLMVKYFHQYDLKPNLLVVRRYMNTNWNSTRSQLIWAINRLGLTNLWKIPKSEHTLTYLPSGQQILFKGFDDAQSITSITVADGHLCWVWIEEAFQITSEDSFNKLDMSIRGELPEPLFKQFVITFNPWSDKSWLKRRFFDVKSDKILALTTTYLCNEFLSKDDVEIFEEMKIQNYNRYKIEGLGEWGIAQGLIYTNWEIQRFNIAEIVEKNRGNSSFVPCNGMDFGYNDPTAMIGAFADKKNYTIYIYYEFFQVLMENRKIAKQIIADGFGKSIIRADRADARTINELKLLGLQGIRPASMKNGAGSVVSGIQKLQDYRIIVHPKCTNMIEALSNYSWKKDRLTDKITNEPEHEFSHCCVTSDTLINTIDGKIPIKDLIGKETKVYSYNLTNKKIELRTMLDVAITGKDKKLYELELVNGDKVKLTFDHKVLTKRGYVECGKLTENDEIICVKKHIFKFKNLLYRCYNLFRSLLNVLH